LNECRKQWVHNFLACAQAFPPQSTRLLMPFKDSRTVFLDEFLFIIIADGGGAKAGSFTWLR
jgi:hypothetical protein